MFYRLFFCSATRCFFPRTKSLDGNETFMSTFFSHQYPSPRRQLKSHPVTLSGKMVHCAKHRRSIILFLLSVNFDVAFQLSIDDRNVILFINSISSMFEYLIRISLNFKLNYLLRIIPIVGTSNWTKKCVHLSKCSLIKYLIGLYNVLRYFYPW